MESFQGREDNVSEYNKSLREVNNQLEGLTLKFTSPQNSDNGLISGNEYQTLKATLLKRKNGLESELSDTGKEIEQWVELSERTFNFARYARVWFENGDNATKRSILGCLGSNLVLKDQKINVQLHPFFFSIFENKKSLTLANVYARTSENVGDKRQKDALASSRHTWLRDQESLPRLNLCRHKDFSGKNQQLLADSSGVEDMR